MPRRSCARSTSSDSSGVTARPSRRSVSSTTVTRAAEFPSAGGDLEPDEATADDDDLSCGAEARRQSVGVREGAHRVDPVEVGALDPETAVDRARRQGEALEGEGPARGRRGAASGGVPADRHDGVTRDELDPEVGEPGGVVEDEGAAVVLAAQVALRQGWPLVGRLGFGADEHDGLRVTELAQGRDERDAGLPGADDEGADGRGGGHASHPRVGP